MTRRRTATLLAAFMGVAILGSLLWQRLGAGDETVSIKRVLVDIEPAALAAGVERESVRTLAHGVVQSAQGFELRPDEPGSALRVVVEAMNSQQPATPAGHPPVAATTSLTLSVELIEDGRTSARGRSVATAQGEIERSALVNQAFRDALRQLHLVKSADRLDNETLLAWVVSADVSEAQRLRAMQALASRGDRRLTAVLTVRLEDDIPEGEVAAVLQALALLSDPAAIDSVIAYSERQPAAVRKLCIDVVKAAESPRGVPWLFTLSSGHPDADVQAYAREALARLAPDLHAEPPPSGG
jgi:hypothetical protein